MSMLRRVANLIQIKAQQVLSRLDSPESVLEHSYEQLLAKLQEVKLHRAEIIAEQRGLDREVAEADAKAKAAEAEAMTLLVAGDEPAARAALTRKQSLVEHLNPLKAAQAALAEQAATLADYEHTLETRLEQIRLERRLAETQGSAARAQEQAGRALGGIGSDLDRAGAALRQVEAKSSIAQAKAEAIERMKGSGALGNPLERQSAAEQELSTLRAGNAAESELERLKAEIAKKREE